MQRLKYRILNDRLPILGHQKKKNDRQAYKKKVEVLQNECSRGQILLLWFLPIPPPPALPLPSTLPPLLPSSLPSHFPPPLSTLSPLPA